MRSLRLVFPLMVLLVSASGEQFYRMSEQDPDKMSCDVSLDLAIVGAGPGGTYSAYRLKDSTVYRTIGLFEYSGRVGGRVYSYRDGDRYTTSPLELGAMRFIDGIHSTLQGVIAELNLTTKVFVEGLGRPDRTRVYFRDKNILGSEWSASTVPFNLSAEEAHNFGHIFQFYLEKLTGKKIPYTSLTKDECMNLRLQDGRFLYDITWQEAMDLVASDEGRAFIEAHNLFTYRFLTESAAINSFIPNFSNVYRHNKSGEVLTVAGGMSQVPFRLLLEFIESDLENHKVFMNHQLMGIRRKKNKEYVLVFRQTEDIDGFTVPKVLDEGLVACADRVILAIPVHAVKEVDWVGLRQQRVTDALYTIIPSKASKVFMSFNKAWWKTAPYNATVMRSNETFMQLYDWQTNGKGEPTIIASYADVYLSQHLQALNTRGRSINGSAPGFNRVSEPLKEELLTGLAKAYGLRRSDIPEPKSAISQFWTDYPYGCGWTTKRVGHNQADATETLKRPSLHDEVFIVGSDISFTGMTGWIEGSLVTADEVLSKYFYPNP